MNSALVKSKTAIVRAPAKINLCFDILGLRPDGFHDIETIFQAISLEDELKIHLQEASTNEIEIKVEEAFIRKLIPLDGTNLIARAFHLFLRHIGSKCKYKAVVELDKRIPIGAGLAGGSTDAAAVLIALNEMLGQKLSLVELLELGAQLGSDVPFCILGGTALGRGRGEVLERIDRKLDLSLCIVKPLKLAVSTPWAFKTYDESVANQDAAHRPYLSLAAVRQGLENSDLEMTLSGLGNVFQPVIFGAHPELKKLHDDLLSQGVFACHMTGSGPTLFAITPGREMGHYIRRHMLLDDEIGFYYGTEEVIREAHPPIDFRLAETVSYGPRLISLEEH